MEAYEIKHQENKNIQVFHVVGYFGNGAGTDLLTEIDKHLENRKKLFVIDLAGCDVINSLGIAKLFEIASKVSEDFQGKVFLASLSSFFVEVLELSGILDFVETSSNVEAALLLLERE